MLDKVAPDVFDHSLDPGLLRRFLDQPTAILIVALIGGCVIGQLRGFVHRQPDAPSDLYIDNLGVAPSHHRRNIATAMVSTLRAEPELRECRTIWVATELENEGACGFYEAAGFSMTPIAYFERAL